MALVIVGPGRQTAGINRQALLHAIEGLNLRLLVDAQHNGMLWWFQIQADDVHQLLGEMRIVGDLERLHAMRLEIGLLPHPLHHRRRRAQVLGQRPRAPMRGGRRRRSGGRLHNPSREFLFGRRGTTAACGILLNPGQPLLGEAAAPQRDRLAQRDQFVGDLLVLLACGGGQHNLSSQDPPRFHASPPRPALERGSFVVRQRDRNRNSHGFLLLIDDETRRSRISTVIYESLH